MAAPEIIPGPEARMTVCQTEAGWTCHIWARSVGTFIVEMSGTLGPEATRGAALARATSWMRAVFGADLHPKQDAWLRSIVPAQGDLFGAVAA
jgi:hypothetical protein